MTKYDQLGTEEDDLNGRIIQYTFLDIIYFIILYQSVPQYLDTAYCIMLDGRVEIEISNTRI